MSGNRQSSENHIIKYIKKLTPASDHNVNIYKKLFKDMTDKQFDEFINDLETEKKHLSIISPNFAKIGLSVENNLEIAKELGHKFFQKLWIGKNGDIPAHLTPVEYLVIDLPVRRQSQLLTKKISVPDHNRTIDALTGQPTGESKGAKISYPELQVCAAMGLDNTMIELMKYRGGDIKGNVAMSAMLSKYGTANLATLSQYASGVESTKSLKAYLLAMMLQNTL